jgi:hypothetical protein
MNTADLTKDEGCPALRRFRWNFNADDLQVYLTYFSQGKGLAEPSQGLNSIFKPEQI